MLLALQLNNLLEGGGADTTPDAFTFTDITDATLDTVYTSNTITVTGIDASATVSITGGTYSKNGGAYTASAGTADNGDTFAVRVTSSASYDTAVDVELDIGGVTDTYTVTTIADAGPITSGAGRKRDSRRRGFLTLLVGRG